MFLGLLDPDPLKLLPDTGSLPMEAFFKHNPNYFQVTSVADPNPDPPDPRVFGPHGSGSIKITSK